MARMRAIGSNASQPQDVPAVEILPRQASRPVQASADEPPPTWPLRVVDILLLVAFLVLARLRAFPLRDTDFWWHLRTGDLIRQTGRVPQTDWYTYTWPNNPGPTSIGAFQVLLSWGISTAAW